MRHRATTRYKNGRKHKGKTVPQAEVNRRIAQSYGRTWMNTVFEEPQKVFEKKMNTQAGDTVFI